MQTIAALNDKPQDHAPQAATNMFMPWFPFSKARRGVFADDGFEVFRGSVKKSGAHWPAAMVKKARECLDQHVFVFIKT
jgi:hypothetical protein